MIQVQRFTFNPVAENTYVLWNDEKQGIIIDPGCYFEREEEELKNFIRDQGIQIEKIVLTHAHFDHILGGGFVSETYKVPIESHPLSAALVKMLPQISKMYGIPAKDCPEPTLHINEGQAMTFGKESFEVFYCPGHSPDSIVFYHAGQGFLIGGDVLFNGSIGRTDLPGGDHETLLQSIREKLFVLPPETIVMPGHGEYTTIGEEKRSNPFLT